MTRRRLALVLGVPVGLVALGAAVLVVEVIVAQRGPRLEDPTELSGTVREGGAGAPRVVWLGDSTAAGVGADRPEGSVALQVAEAGPQPTTVIVLASSGALVADVVDHQLPLVDDLGPDVVLISVGSNDVTHLTRRDDVRRHYRALLDGLPRGVTAVVLGVPDMGSIPRLAQPLRALAGLRGRQLDGVVREVARDHGAAYVDLAGTTGPAFRAEPGRLFAADRYHPSDDGYAVWADAVAPVMERAMADVAGAGDGRG